MGEVSNDGEGLQDGKERKVKWGNQEGTQEEYDEWREKERERIDSNPQLVAFYKHLKDVEKGVDEDLGEVKVRGGGSGGSGGVKGSPRSLYLSDETWEALVGMAVEAGFVRGSRGNVSALIDAWVWNKLEGV